MTRKITLAAVLLAVFALFAGACSSDSDESSSTTEKKETTTTEAGSEDDEEATTDTVSDEEFETQITAFTDTIKNADGDTCTIFEAVNADTQFADPANPGQVEVALTVYDVMFNAIADTAPPESAAEADTIRAAADALKTEGAENDYDPEWFLSAASTAFSGEEVSAALESYFTQAQTLCAPETPTTVAG
jgi:hypothetical protein